MILISQALRIRPLFNLKYSLDSLFSLFRVTAFPIRLETVTPIRGRSNLPGIYRITKKRSETFFPRSDNNTKSDRFRILSAFFNLNCVTSTGESIRP